jgi:hypothetical protein
VSALITRAVAYKRTCITLLSNLVSLIISTIWGRSTRYGTSAPSDTGVGTTKPPGSGRYG